MKLVGGNMQARRFWAHLGQRVQGLSISEKIEGPGCVCYHLSHQPPSQHPVFQWEMEKCWGGKRGRK